MAQLVVRNLPDDVKERLKRRAKRHGHSLEAEARQILSQTPELPPAHGADDDWTAEHVRKLAEIGTTGEDIDALNEGIAELRADRQMRNLDIGAERPRSRRRRPSRS